MIALIQSTWVWELDFLSLQAPVYQINTGIWDFQKFWKSQKKLFAFYAYKSIVNFRNLSRPLF